MRATPAKNCNKSKGSKLLASLHFQTRHQQSFESRCTFHYLICGNEIPVTLTEHINGIQIGHAGNEIHHRLGIQMVQVTRLAAYTLNCLEISCSNLNDLADLGVITALKIL